MVRTNGVLVDDTLGFSFGGRHAGGAGCAVEEAA